MADPGGNTLPRLARAEHIGPNDTGDNIEAKRVAAYVWNGSEWERAVPSLSGSSSSSVTSVSDTASSTTLLSSNTSRKEAVIQNDSDQVLYIKFGATASATDYTARLIQYGILTTAYTGRIDGIWAANSTGAARITELT